MSSTNAAVPSDLGFKQCVTTKNSQRKRIDDKNVKMGCVLAILSTIAFSNNPNDFFVRLTCDDLELIVHMVFTDTVADDWNTTKQRLICHQGTAATENEKSKREMYCDLVLSKCIFSSIRSESSKVLGHD